MCAYGSRRQTPVREYWARGKDDPPLTRNRPKDRQLPAHRGGAARLRSARCRRNLYESGDFHFVDAADAEEGVRKLLTIDYDRDVYNGDLGVVSQIDMEEGELVVDFDGREVTYGFGELDELVLADATTIHKSQGSEYPAVVIPLSTQHYPMLQRNLVYTGVTRGKRLVVLIGQRKALAIAVKGARARRRWSKRREWLGGQ
jgi:ATP-dependent exoDNAse (exonuclease V) alpha subunit